MIHQFINAKHWHIFMIIMVIPVVIYMFFFLQLFSDAVAGIRTNTPPKIGAFMPVFSLILAIQLFGIFGWMWSVSVGLHNKLPASMRMNLKQFKFFFIFPIIYLIFFMGYMTVLFTKMEQGFNNQNPEAFFKEILPLFAAIIIILPLHFFALFCIIYCYQFSAKTLRSIELGRKAETGEYIGEFFMFWFSLVGVWIMQPRITKIYLNFPDNALKETNLNDGITPVEPVKFEDKIHVEKLRGQDHDAFRYDDDFDGLL